MVLMTRTSHTILFLIFSMKKYSDMLDRVRSFITRHTTQNVTLWPCDQSGFDFVVYPRQPALKHINTVNHLMLINVRQVPMLPVPLPLLKWEQTLAATRSHCEDKRTGTRPRRHCGTFFGIIEENSRLVWPSQPRVSLSGPSQDRRGSWRLILPTS